MSRDPARAATQFFGGCVCLDFANTVDWRTSDRPIELIADYRAFLEWSRRRATLPARAVARLAAASAASPAAAAAVMRTAVSLRQQIWNLADALRQHRSVDIAAINRLIARLPPQPPLTKQRGGYVHDLKGDALEEPLWPVLWSLTAVLSSSDADRIGCCEAQGCGWYFIDESPNRARLWCSSEVCGNRERVRRAYAKRRAR